MKTIQEPLVFAPKTIQTILSDNAIGFNIPIYQRLYAWSRREVITLLEDIDNSCNVSPEKDYYIGNLTLHYNRLSQRFDIIDGQQRMTTLWLIGLVLKHKAKTNGWFKFLEREGEVLLRFAAREDDNNFLKELLEKDNLNEIELSAGGEINEMMIEAIKCICEYFSSIDIDKTSTYIYERLKLVAIYLPDNIDLNKYFEDMNNRGLQLEGHHILKALLLGKIRDSSLHSGYAEIWDAVAQMNQYIEYGFPGTLKENREKLSKNDIRFFVSGKNDKNETAFKIKDFILETIKTDYKSANDNPNIKEERDNITSIINFPEFLLHCLRLQTSNDEISIDDKKLIETFTPYINKFDEEITIEFLKLIFKVRILFDSFFIKSISTNDGSRWEIRNIVKKDEDNFERKKHLDGNITQIQSMLNVSMSASLWFTTAMKCVIDNNNISEADFLTNLENIDKRIHPQLPIFSEMHKGVYTQRYWFYKIDYILWKKWMRDNDGIPQVQGINDLKNKVTNFQFRDNRSVEHLQPINPDSETWTSENEKQLKQQKDRLGNLALISVSSNSGYNNQLPSSKRQDFIKKTNKWGIESLKLVSMYSYDDWNISTMQKHEESIVVLLCNEYQRNFNDYTQYNENPSKEILNNSI